MGDDDLGERDGHGGWVFDVFLGRRLVGELGQGVADLHGALPLGNAALIEEALHARQAGEGAVSEVGEDMQEDFRGHGIGALIEGRYAAQSAAPLFGHLVGDVGEGVILLPINRCAVECLVLGAAEAAEERFRGQDLLHSFAPSLRSVARSGQLTADSRQRWRSMCLARLSRFCLFLVFHQFLRRVSGCLLSANSQLLKTAVEPLQTPCKTRGGVFAGKITQKGAGVLYGPFLRPSGFTAFRRWPS